MAWTVLTAFVTESVVFGLSALPAVLFWEWHLRRLAPTSWIRIIVLAMSLVPAYLLFAVCLMWWSAAAVRLLGWRSPDHAAMPIADRDWPVLRWARYAVSTHVVRVLVGTVLRSTPLWTWYHRLNGARFGRRVLVNSVMLADHNLLEFGDDVVIGADVHVSGHTVEGGRLRTGRVRLGSNVTIGLASVIDIDVEISSGCEIGGGRFRDGKRTRAGTSPKRSSKHPTPTACNISQRSPSECGMNVIAWILA